MHLIPVQYPIHRATWLASRAIRRVGQVLPCIALAAACGVAGLPPASAQTCMTPAVLIPPDGGGSNTGNTLLGDTSIPYTCGGGVSLLAPVFVYRVHFGGFTATEFAVFSESPGWTPTMYVTDGSEPCGTGQCLAYGEEGFPMPFSSIPPGDHWLLVTASEPDGADGGGAFEIAIVGYEEVQDTIFQDGFEQGASGP